MEKLLEKAKELVKVKYGNKKNQKNAKIQLGFFLKAHFGFGKDYPWTIKDLNEAQLKMFIDMVDRQVNGYRCCFKHGDKKLFD